MEPDVTTATHGVNLLAYLFIPVISGLIGWITNIIAIKMMFYPIEFVGKPPWLGWQGIIPSKIEKMASITVDMITSKLISVEEVFSRLDPKRVADEVSDSLEAMLEPMVHSIMASYSPRLWNTLPDKAKDAIYNASRADRPIVVARIMEEVKNNIGQMFDLKSMVITALVRNKPLMNRIFLDCGKKEFKFIAISGLYLGFLFGIVQAVIWYHFKSWWLLPMAGLAVGYITNWLALKMIFQPVHPRDFGPITLQGVFLMRQREVAEEYGRLIATEIVNPRNIIGEMLRGPMTDQFVAIIEKHVRDAVDTHAGIAKPVVEAYIGSKNYQLMKEEICNGIIDGLPGTLETLENYATEAMDIRTTLTEKLAGLSPDDYMGILRPAFQQDEWKLIVAGGILGFLVGLIQLVTMFGDTL